MSSHLPRIRPSRRAKPLVGAFSREDRVVLAVRARAESMRREISAALDEIGARLNRDPNGYVVAQAGMIVARCPNLDAVKAWLRERTSRAAHDTHAPAPARVKEPA